MNTGHDNYWKHYCKPEKGFLFTLDGEPCNWCDVPQSGPLTTLYTDEQGRKVSVTVDFHDEIHTHPLKDVKVL